MAVLTVRRCVWASLLLCVTAVTQAKEAVPEDTPPDGAALARALEEQPQEQEELLPQIDLLTSRERARFVGWAERRREEQGWLHLAPALVRLGTPGAAAELGAMARSNSEVAFAALDGLRQLPRELLLPQLVEGLTCDARHARAAAWDGLADLLVEDPHDMLLEVEMAWGMALDRSPELFEALAEVTARAMVDVEDDRPFTDRISWGAPAPICAGVVRGIRMRLADREAKRRAEEARLAREAEQDPERPVDPGGLDDPDEPDYPDDPLEPEEPEPELTPEQLEETAWEAEQAAWEAELAWLEDPSRHRYEAALIEALERHWDVLAISLEAMRTAPLVVVELDSWWVQVFTDFMTDESRELAWDSWQALRQISGQDLPQSRRAWELWWEREEEDE
jgi:hypothetical protein